MNAHLQSVLEYLPSGCSKTNDEIHYTPDCKYLGWQQYLFIRYDSKFDHFEFGFFDNGKRFVSHYYSSTDPKYTAHAFSMLIEKPLYWFLVDPEKFTDYAYYVKEKIKESDSDTQFWILSNIAKASFRYIKYIRPEDFNNQKQTLHLIASHSSIHTEFCQIWKNLEAANSLL